MLCKWPNGRAKFQQLTSETKLHIPLCKVRLPKLKPFMLSSTHNKICGIAVNSANCSLIFTTTNEIQKSAS